MMKSPESANSLGFFMRVAEYDAERWRQNLGGGRASNRTEIASVRI